MTIIMEAIIETMIMTKQRISLSRVDIPLLGLLILKGVATTSYDWIVNECSDDDSTVVLCYMK